MERSYKDVFKLKEFRKLLLSDIVSRFGDSIDAIAFSWLAYELSGQASWSAIVFTVNMLPTIFLQPLMGVLVDRLKKKNIMVFCDIVRFALVTLCFILFKVDLLNPWILLLITFLNSTVEAFRLPAGPAIIPELVDKEDYEMTTSLSNSSSRLMELLGTGASGFIIAIFGIGGAMIVDACTFLISAILVSTIKTKEVVKTEQVSEKTSYKEDLVSGFKYIFNHKLFLVVAMMAVVVNFLFSPVNALLAPYVAESLNGQTQYLSLISVFMSLGMLLGSIIVPKISKTVSFQTRMIIPLSICGLYFIGMSLVPSVASNQLLCISSLILLNLLLGISVGILNTSIGVRFMMIVDPNYLARAISAFGAACTIAMPISSSLSSLAVNFISIPNLFLYIGIITTALISILGFKLHKVIKNLNSSYETNTATELQDHTALNNI